MLLKVGLRIDPVLMCSFSEPSFKAALISGGFDLSPVGLENFLVHWIHIMQPIYLMAATPAGFKYPPETEDGKAILDVLFKVTRKYHLPIALKFGCIRSVNPALKAGGDSVTTVDVSHLQRLCSSYPDIKILATFLARVNQHEV